MKKEFVEFLIKRMETKLGYMSDAASHDEIVSLADDVSDYLSTLKEIVIEVIKP